MAKKVAYYDSTYIRDGLVPETDRTPAVTFAYHPPTTGQRKAFVTRRDKIGGDSAAMLQLQIEVIQQQMTRWDLEKPMDGTDPNVDPCPMQLVNFHDAAEMSRIDPWVIDRIWEIIMGNPRTIEEQKKQEAVAKN